MKNTILFLFLIFFASESIAQDQTHCSSANQSELSLSVISKDISEISSNVTFQFCLRTRDSSISIDTLLFNSEFASFSGFNTTLSQGTYAGTDSVIYNISFHCDTSQLPYYPKEIQFTVVTGKDIYRTQATVYFTPWNTIKIMNFADFHDPSYVWTIGNDDAQRTQSFIALDSFQSVYDSTLPTSYRHIEGSAISVQHNYDTAFVDTDTSSSPNAINLLRKFEGRIKGRVQVPYNNEWTQNVNVNVANILISVVQDRGGGNLKPIASGYTDENSSNYL
jgi:hypothetical protein